ncbi:MAG: hypothetical protein IT385_06940 [Deltaproteobacteria bacterium]|nr:hypothetical protein [Deltaproteobacteria bacterium]
MSSSAHEAERPEIIRYGDRLKDRQALLSVDHLRHAQRESRRRAFERTASMNQRIIAPIAAITSPDERLREAARESVAAAREAVESDTDGRWQRLLTSVRPCPPGYGPPYDHDYTTDLPDPIDHHDRMTGRIGSELVSAKWSSDDACTGVGIVVHAPIDGEMLVESRVIIEYAASVFALLGYARSAGYLVLWGVDLDPTELATSLRLDAERIWEIDAVGVAPLAGQGSGSWPSPHRLDLTMPVKANHDYFFAVELHQYAVAGGVFAYAGNGCSALVECITAKGMW